MTRRTGRHEPPKIDPVRERPLREGMWFEKMAVSLPSREQLADLMGLARKAQEKQARQRARRGCPTGRLHPACSICQYPAAALDGPTRPTVKRAGLRAQRKDQRQARRRSQAAARARR